MRLRFATLAGGLFALLVSCGGSSTQAPVNLGGTTGGGAIAAGSAGASGDDAAGAAGDSAGGNAGTGGAAAGAAGAGPDWDDGVFKVMNWNIETFPLTAQTPDKVRAVIAQVNPDLIGIEEIEDVATFYDMVGKMPGYDQRIAADAGNMIRVGMIFRTARISEASTVTIFNTAADENAFPRPPLQSHLTVKDHAGNTQIDFELIVVHQKALSGADNIDRRKAGMVALEAYIRGKVDGGSTKWLSVGDYNDDPTDAASQNVFEPFLMAPDRYTILTLAADQAGNYSYPGKFQSFIDHQIATSDMLTVYGDGSSTVPLPLEQDDPTYIDTVSDHRPVLSTWKLPAAPLLFRSGHPAVGAHARQDDGGGDEREKRHHQAPRPMPTRLAVVRHVDELGRYSRPRQR